ncbi:MAG: hypothetical protein Q8880_07195, partial [Bacteroidota bacterium]|nr:hypothetical protein [Bacteroidota bacterium]
MQRKIICLLSLMAVLLLFGKVYSQIDMWKIQFSYNLSEGKKGQAGIETDGKFLYTSKFSTDTFCKYDLKGSFKEFFTIDSVSLIRDLAFDGKYFYGGNIDTVIYQMDFDAKKLINKIYCHNLKVRHIAYDSVRDAFWVGNSSSDIYLVTRNGAIIDTISQKVHGLRSIYGSAYDYITAGGPYLWLFDQSGKGANLVAIRLKNGIKENTGIIHDVIGDISYKMTNPLAGGLFIAKNIVDNTTTIGGLIQTQPDIAFGYDLATLLYKSDIGIQKVINPSNEYSCQLTSNEKISIRVTNSGLDTITNFIAGYILNNKDTVTSNVNYKIAPGENYDVFFPDRDLSGKQYYNFHFYILLQNDLNKKNDTLNYKISTSDSKITVNLLTDKYSDETSWGIINSETNEIIDYISGLYPNTFYKTNVCVADDQCYNFVFLDSYGDGLISPGFYSVYYNDKLVGYDSSFSKKKDVIYNIGKCKANDASISIYTMGKIPLEAGSPHTVAAIVRNAGTNEINNLPVTLNVSGANIFSDVKTITSLKPLENDTIYFSPYTLLNKGNNVV